MDAVAGIAAPKPAPKRAPVKKAPVKPVAPAKKGKGGHSSTLLAAVEKLHAGYNIKDVNKFISLH